MTTKYQPMYTIKEFANAFSPPFTRQAILKHIDPKHIDKGNIPVKQGRRGYLIDIDNFKVKEFIKNSERKFTEKLVEVTGKEKKEKKKLVGVKKEKPAKKEKPVKVKKQKEPKKKKPVEDDLPYDIYNRLDSGDMLTATEIVNLPKDWVEKIKLYEQIKSLNQNREEKRKDLIQRRLIRSVFGKLYEIDQTQFLTLKTKIVPGLAGAWSESQTITKEMVGKKIEVFTGNKPEAMTAADKIIDDSCYRILNNIKHDMDKFLKKIHDEPIN